jgi:predicted O-methyltransferase YrrM
VDSLAALEQAHGGDVDLVFIDADKANYGAYYDAALRMLRVGGLVVVDNTLWSGRVAGTSTPTQRPYMHAPLIA